MSQTLIYSAHAHSVKGRGGHTETSNNVSFDIEMPKIPKGVSRTGATTPEDLFAAAYSACFGGTLEAVARAENAKVNIGTIDLTVNLQRNDGGLFDLEAVFSITIGGPDKHMAESLLQKAHEACPYSRAIRNNVNVRFDVKTK